LGGAALRLGRLFDRESGRSFITAFDHGTTLRIPPEVGKPLNLLEKLVAGEPDGVLIGPGMLKQGARLFAFRGAPVPVLRADWTIIDEGMKKDLGERYRVLTTPKEGAALGAGALVMYLIMGPEEGSMFADNVAAVANAAHEAHQVGLPLIVEATLWGSRIEDKKDPERLGHICRIAAEIGADAIKTEYTGDDGRGGRGLPGAGTHPGRRERWRRGRRGGRPGGHRGRRQGADLRPQRLAGRRPGADDRFPARGRPRRRVR
jgi:fructose-bisphosphate aldolase, class I